MAIQEIQRAKVDMSDATFPAVPDLLKKRLFPRVKIIDHRPRLRRGRLYSNEANSVEALSNISDLSELFDTVSTTAATIAKRFIPKDVDQEKAFKVLDNKDFSGVSSSSEEYDRFLSVALVRTRIERQLVRAAIKERKDSSLAISETERIILMHSMDLGDQFDQFYLQWRQNVVTSELGKELEKRAKINPESAKKYLQERGANIPNTRYIYVTFNERPDGNIQTVPYAEEFANPINAMSLTIDHLVTDLEGNRATDEREENDRQGYINYFKAFKSAFISTEPQEQEEKFKKLDEVWMDKIKGRIQIVHPIETYADPINMRVNPGLIVAVKDDRKKDLNDKIEVTKTAAITYLETNYGNLDDFPSSKHVMENSIAFIAVVLGAGNRTDTPFGGQTAPNRPEVKSSYGVKIIENLQAFRSSKPDYEALLTKVFGENFVNQHFANTDEMINYLAVIHVPGHEVAHNFLASRATENVLNPTILQQIEEHKADMVGILAAQEYLDPANQDLAMKTLLAWSLRQMKRRDDTKAKPYYNAALTYLKTMHDVGMLSGDSQTPWTFQTDPEKIESFYQKTKGIFDELVDVYVTPVPEKAQQFVDTYYKDEPQYIRDIQRKIGLPPRDAIVFPSEQT